MRKYDRNAAFNIALKCILFAAVFAGCFAVLFFVFGAGWVLSAAVSLLPALLIICIFSLLLRYTRFYYAYYSFVSAEITDHVLS